MCGRQCSECDSQLELRCVVNSRSWSSAAAVRWLQAVGHAGACWRAVRSLLYEATGTIAAIGVRIRDVNEPDAGDALARPCGLLREVIRNDRYDMSDNANLMVWNWDAHRTACIIPAFFTVYGLFCIRNRPSTCIDSKEGKEGTR